MACLAGLLDLFSNQQLKLITCEMTKDSYDFVVLTVHRHGSDWVKNFIRVLWRSPLVSLVTNILWAAFHLFMTSQMGSYVASECSNRMSVEDDRLLNEAAIACCLGLALDHEGSVPLIMFINTIPGLKRYRLLNICREIKCSCQRIRKRNIWFWRSCYSIILYSPKKYAIISEATVHPSHFRKEAVISPRNAWRQNGRVG